jgi:hypothetical protein
VSGARAHIDAYLTAEPAQTGRVLRDPDLETLRADATWMAALRARIRPAGRTVRSLVFERRESGGDLFTIAEDGLDERPLAADPDWREYRASMSGDGERVVYLASRFSKRRVLPRNLGDGNPQRDWSDLREHGRLYPRRIDHELRSVPFGGGAHVVLAEDVHAYRIDQDGRTVLFVDEPERNRLRLASVPITGGSATAIGELGADASAWCFAREPGGTVIVAEGIPDDWSPSLRVRVRRFGPGGAVTELLAPRRPRPSEPRMPDFETCHLSENQLHLGLARVVLAPSPSLEYVPGAAMGWGAYNFRRMGERGGVAPGARPAVYLTVVGDGEEPNVDEELPPGPPPWQVSPLAWDNSNGMSSPWRYATRIARVSWDGTGLRMLSSGRAQEYGPSVSRDGRSIAFTRVVPRGEPWIVVSDPAGGAPRPVVPGQYPIWR